MTATKDLPNAPLYDAIGSRDDVPVTVDIDPDTNLIDAVYLEGRRYATGRQAAAVVVGTAVGALGSGALTRRRRVTQLRRRDAP